MLDDEVTWGSRSEVVPSCTAPDRVPNRDGEDRVRRDGTIADRVIAGVVPIPPSYGEHQVRPIRLGELGGVRGDGSLRYGLATLDHGGRVADQALIHALGWRPDETLNVRAVSGAVIIRPHPQGVYTLLRRGRVLVPAAVRRWCALMPGDRVLLAGAVELRVLVVHPMSTLDSMVLAYHSLHAERDW